MNFIEYVKQLWKNGPNGGTPWSASRLNHMEEGIKANNEMISELNSNINNYDGVIKNGSIDFESQYFKQGKAIYFHIISTATQSDIVGFPVEVYGYGVLITFKSTISWGSCQIYIPHCSSNSDDRRSLYIRTFGDINNIWRKLSTITIDSYN